MSVDEIKRFAAAIRSPSPAFWIAQYDDKYSKLKIPQCRSCGSFIRVVDYSNIICNNKECQLFGKETASFNWSDFALNNGLIAEYKDDGSENISFKMLPLDRMNRFFFYIAPKEQLVGIDLRNGEYVIDGTEIGVGMALNRIPIVVSNQLQKYNDFFCLKSFLQSLGGSNRFIWYKMGYICQLKQMRVAMMLFVHIPTLHPYFFAELLSEVQ